MIGDNRLDPRALLWQRITAVELLGEGIHSSPAFGDGCIYIRGEKHLYCIGDAQQTGPPSGKR